MQPPPYNGQGQQPPYPMPGQQPPYPMPGQQPPYPMPGQDQQAPYPIPGQAGNSQGFMSAVLKSSDVEQANNSDLGSTFDDANVRRAFMRKVYFILCMQLTLTVLLMAIIRFVTPITNFFLSNIWIFYVFLAITFVIIITLSCCEGPRRTFPTNLILLATFTFCEGCVLGMSTLFFKLDAILIAGGLCVAITLALTLFAFQTKIDFTGCGGFLCGALVVLVIASFLMMFLPQSKWLQIVYGAAGALLFSVYIVYDTQLMMGGNHKYSISPEEYIFASLSLYLDIINLFLFLLQIIGAASND